MLKPENLNISKVSQDNNIGVFVFEPLPSGFGNTIGNALRRVLYSSLEGAAITQIKISGVLHQFTTIPGVKEDVVDITLNFKRVRVKLNSKNAIVGVIDKKGPGVVTAGDIQFPSDAEVVNPDLVIATLADSKTKFEAEVLVEPGVGFSPVEERETSKIGVILLDSVFSPVIKVSYLVEPVRFGKKVDLDKLTLTVETDGTITPWEAVSQAASILKDFFSVISNWREDGGGENTKGESLASSTGARKNYPIDELPISNRSINALKKHGIKNLEELAALSDEQIRDIKNLGDKSVAEILDLLAKEGFR